MSEENNDSFKSSVRYFNAATPPKPELLSNRYDISKKSTKDLITREIPSILPISEQKEYFIQVRASIITEIRELASETNNKKFDNTELILFLASLVFNFMFTNFTFFSNELVSKIIYQLSYILFGGLVVAYCFMKKQNIILSSDISVKVLKLLPDTKENKPNEL